MLESKQRTLVKTNKSNLLLLRTSFLKQ
ncbi:hypothetical protein V12B01_13740 [Vibrio splendidus 12B01]|nr:hypothetical protein V12B01_13740 [Vibrio splendidus 12B01]EAQ55086.1 hypothetical protein MED222_05710 [Vibrio sp. MED222]